tara:strand:- start:63 stop:530 length:468 start_codon:yes stop_codon:yes gene_type:complete
MTIKSFRGLIDTQSQQRITLHTNNGSTGYRIKKFMLFPKNVGASTSGNEYESLVNIYKVEQTTLSGISADFSDQTLLAAGTYFSEVSGSPAYVIGSNADIVFDNEVFNQDIYIVHENFHNDNSPINYYIELEQTKLDLTENTVATLKDIRNIASQ